MKPPPSLRDRERLWEACRPDLGPGGSARAIYALGTDERDFDALLRALPRGPWRCAFSIDGWAAPLPKYGIEAFAIWRESEPLLEVAVGPAVVRCRFRSLQELELELEPADIGDPAALEALVHFMAWLGRLLRRSVLLAPDGAPDRPILEYVDATRRVRFHPVASA